MQNSSSTVSWEAAVQALRGQPGAAELVKACFYDDPLQAAADRFWLSTEWRATRSHLPSKMGQALDIGAGRGIASYAMARDGWDVTALEPDNSAVVGTGAIRQLAVAAKLAIEVCETWGEELPFKPATFDLVYCRQVLHHAKNLTELCREIGRVLKPGGVFVAAREHVITRRSDLSTFLDSHPLHRLYGGENAYLLDEYRSALRNAGLQIDRILNPMQSDINLYPSSSGDIKRRWAKRLHLPTPRLVPAVALRLRGALDNTPGRLFTFVGRKPVQS